jgi:FkbM family methyltransferase
MRRQPWYETWYGSWHESWRTTRGVVRSLRLYYGDRERRAAMDRLYSRFVKAGDLVFDIGAHVGDRAAVFRRFGARVVAVEPQPALIRTLKLLYGRDPALAIEPVAVGRNAGMLELKLNVDNPTVSTASEAFRKAANGAAGWEGQAWTRTIRVPVTTLDARLYQDRCRGFRSGRAGGTDASLGGAVVRIHHHPARRGEGVHRALRKPRLYPLQRGAGRDPCAGPPGLGER